jgi:cytidine deaminase
LLVIRFLKTYTLANSKPCLNCIQNMNDLPKKRGYKIEDIYYSENDETIIKTSINKLLNESSHHISSYYRNSRYLQRH